MPDNTTLDEAKKFAGLLKQLSEAEQLAVLEPVHIKIASKIIAKEITAQKMISSLS